MRSSNETQPEQHERGASSCFSVLCCGVCVVCVVAPCGRVVDTMDEIYAHMLTWMHMCDIPLIYAERESKQTNGALSRRVLVSC